MTYAKKSKVQLRNFLERYPRIRLAVKCLEGNIRTWVSRLESDQGLNITSNYLKQNYGAIFIVGFILLMVFGIIELNLGDSSLAIGITVYAVVLLALGIVLQAFSYFWPGFEKRHQKSFENTFRKIHDYLRSSRVGRSKNEN